MKTYQSGSLTEAQCAMIASALDAHISSGELDEEEEAAAQILHDLFADPGSNLIDLGEET